MTISRSWSPSGGSGHYQGRRPPFERVASRSGSHRLLRRRCQSPCGRCSHIQRNCQKAYSL